VKTSVSRIHVIMVVHARTSGGTSVVHVNVHILDTPASTVSVLSATKTYGYYIYTFIPGEGEKCANIYVLNFSVLLLLYTLYVEIYLVLCLLSNIFSILTV
jgi:hypothetical protein